MSISILEQVQPNPHRAIAPEAARRPAIGDARRVGVELEFADLSVGRAADVTAAVFGANVRMRDRHFAQVVGDPDGVFTVELDTRLVAKVDEDSETMATARAWFGDLAALVVPVEVASPPMSVSRVAEIDALVAALRRAGASGSHRSVFYAFGAHLNVEAERLDADEILCVLRAYLLVEEWLRAQIDVNPARAAAGFEKRFPAAYQTLALDPDYAPDMTTLIDDYLRWNPTRNRGLDLLPLFAEIDEARVRDALPGESVSARPAFHYRLPNSEVDDARWSVRRELKRWAVVENLAADQRMLERAVARRFQLLQAPLASVTTRMRQAADAIALGAELSARGAEQAQ